MSFNNGTYNIKTDQFIPVHNKKDYLTHSFNFDFNRSAKCPQFEKFLDESFEGDKELIELLRAAFKWSLLPKDRKKAYEIELFFDLFGRRGSGKGTLLEVLMAVVGGEDSCGTIRSNTFDKPTSLYSLVGKKIAIDPDSSGHIKNVGIFNSIVSNEPVEVKKLFLNESSKRIGVVVWRAYNDNPSASGGGVEGIGRRIVTFKFKRISSNPDPTLKTKLLEEVAGIFQWCWSVSKEEAIETLTNRGNIESVANASIENLLDNNPHIRFLQENYFESFVEVNASDLYERYCEWCQEWNHGKLSQTKFGRELIKLHGLIENEKRVAGFYYKIKAFKDFDLAVHFGIKNNAGSTMQKSSTMHPNPSCSKPSEAKGSQKAVHSMNSSLNKKDSIKKNKKDIEKEFIQKAMQTLQPSTIGSGWDVGSEEDDDPHWG